MSIELTNDELIEYAKQAIEKKKATSLKWANYTKRMAWQNKLYKDYAIENGFELPELPEELK